MLNKIINEKIIKKIFVFFQVILFIFFASIKSIFAVEVAIPDPLGVGGDIYKILYRILNFLVYKIGPIVFTLMMAIGAYQILFSSADEKLIKQGKRTIIYAIVGYALLILSLSLEYIINDLFKSK